MCAYTQHTFYRVCLLLSWLAVVDVRVCVCVCVFLFLVRITSGADVVEPELVQRDLAMPAEGGGGAGQRTRAARGGHTTAGYHVVSPGRVQVSNTKI